MESRNKMMRVFRAFSMKRRSIAQSLILSLTTAVTVVTLCAAGWIYIEATNKAHRELQQKVDNTLAYLESVLTIPLWNYDNDVVQKIGRTIMEDRSYQSITIRDSLEYTIFSQQRGDQRAFGRTVRMKHKDEVVGIVELAASSVIVKEQFHEVILNSMFLVLSIVVTITLCTILLIRHFFKGPLMELQAVADAYGSGNYSIEGTQSTYREFQPLLDVLSGMGKKILDQISQLQERKQSLQAVFDGAHDAIIVHDANTGAILQVNKTMCEMYKCSPEEALTLTIGDLSSGVHPYTQKVALKALQTMFHDDTQIPSTVWHAKDREGHLFWVEIYVRGIILGSEKRVLAFARDITDRKLKDEEIRRHREHLEDMVKERTEELERAHKELIKRERLSVLGQLTATVSHELRNPLGVIRTSAFYLHEKLKNADEKTNKHIKRIETQVGLCDSIVGELLEYTRGSLAELTQGNLNQWLEKILDDIHGIEDIPILKALADDLPNVVFDPGKLGRTIINVVNNAVMAVRERTQRELLTHAPYHPRISVATSTAKTDVIIEIADNGIGMDQNTVIHAFEPLFTTRARGTGLGLANAKKIIEEHGGTIHLESAVNSGTKVTIVMPLKQQSMVRNSMNLSHEKRTGGSK